MSAPFLILHGLHGSGPGHWQTWLAGRLRAAGAHVAYPDLPDADAPRLEAWLEALEGELAALSAPPVVACHSLSCLLWLHHAARAGAPAERVLLVAPPCDQLPELAPFLPAPAVRPREARLVCSDDDAYCPGGAAAVYTGLATDVLPGAGHINPDAGYGPWAAVEAWAREGTVPLTA